jgi:hypothetical protein
LFSFSFLLVRFSFEKKMGFERFYVEKQDFNQVDVKKGGTSI